jgi:hypothetical protein
MMPGLRDSGSLLVLGHPSSLGVIILLIVIVVKILKHFQNRNNKEDQLD